MGWVTLTLRKKNVKTDINETEQRDIELSRLLRSEQRNLAYEQSIFQTDKNGEIKDQKNIFDKARLSKPSKANFGADNEAYVQAYEEWKVIYDQAKEDYEGMVADINDYYDTYMNILEEASTELQEDIENEQTTVEAQLSHLRQELESVDGQIKGDMEASKLSLGS